MGRTRVVVPEKTNAMRALDAATVNYSVHEYALAEDEFSAVAVADQLGLPHGQVFKTLCVQASTGEYCFAIVPAGSNLSLKALAKAAGHKKVEMVPVRDVRAVTGYPRGSVTVMAARKIFQSTSTPQRRHGTRSQSQQGRVVSSYCSYQQRI